MSANLASFPTLHHSMLFPVWSASILALIAKMGNVFNAMNPTVHHPSTAFVTYALIQIARLAAIVPSVFAKPAARTIKT